MRKSTLALRAAVLAVILALAGCSGSAAEQATITPPEAQDHIGKQATVCGTVASATYAYATRGRPTFLNLDKPYPHQVFTVVIWGRNRGAFGSPEVELKGKRVCVSGVISAYRGVAQVEASDPSQIKVF